MAKSTHIFIYAHTFEIAMFSRFYVGIVGLSLCSAIFACSADERAKRDKKTDPKELKEKLIEANKILSQKEDLRIEAFVKRMNWPMLETGTGLRYWVYESDSGKSIVENDVVKVDFQITLLDGTLCYSSQENGPQTFKVGMDNVEGGLHEAMTYLREGDKARIVLPPHLAHGLIGDRQKIPGNSSIVYDLKVLQILE